METRHGVTLWKLPSDDDGRHSDDEHGVQSEEKHTDNQQFVDWRSDCFYETHTH